MAAPRTRPMHPLVEAVGREAWGARTAARLTRAEAAQRSGISTSTLQRIETGERAADMDQLAALSTTYGIALAELIRRAEDGMGGRVVTTSETPDSLP